ncbi:hypothetical protein IEO21_11221 [Rhodonia placenta]|uniref:Uncharacterized protein n=1 Tax=Rhodonia placenta TaxID=104341 RepID=A0A8H7NQT1_9APHY|nr:hypothetical protein IEO21_11221 [Postia placenta]
MRGCCGGQGDVGPF